MANWRYETWNEPDLRVYNKLNLTAQSYLDYVQAVRRGLSKAGNLDTYEGKVQLPMYRALRGPAGLFKSSDTHPLCWKLLEQCNEKVVYCPIDILTFHRKGVEGKATEIVNGSLSLMAKIYEDYPNLKPLPVANE